MKNRIAGNIRCLRNLKNLSQEELADELGITRARLVTYENGRNEPPIEIILKIADYFHISIDALLKADLLKTHPEALMKVGKNRILLPIVLDKSGRDLVEVIPGKAIAGYLRGYADPEYIESLQRLNLPFLPTGKHRAFPIKGDSMPPLTDGSFVIGKYIENPDDIRDGNTYVLLTRDEGIVYKRVRRDAKSKRKLMLYSDNTQYAPYPIDLSDILEVWEYACSINTSTYKKEELNLDSILSMMREMKIEMERLTSAIPLKKSR